MIDVETLESEFQLLKEDLIKKHQELGMKASGLWESELQIEIADEDGVIKATLSGLSYTEQLVYGRKPGKMPPIKAIEQWIIDKGISIEKKMKASSLAYLIARKIAKEGTKYFQNGGTDLIESVVTPERIQSIIDKVNLINVSTMTDGIFEQVRQATA